MEYVLAVWIICGLVVGTISAILTNQVGVSMFMGILMGPLPFIFAIIFWLEQRKQQKKGP